MYKCKKQTNQVKQVCFVKILFFIHTSSRFQHADKVYLIFYELNPIQLKVQNEQQPSKSEFSFCIITFIPDVVSFSTYNTGFCLPIFVNYVHT